MDSLFDRDRTARAAAVGAILFRFGVSSTDSRLSRFRWLDPTPAACHAAFGGLRPSAAKRRHDETTTTT
jgi:hypothetical protein